MNTELYLTQLCMLDECFNSCHGNASVAA